jgi:hypothetical protein
MIDAGHMIWSGGSSYYLTGGVVALARLREFGLWSYLFLTGRASLTPVVQSELYI